MSDIYDVYGPHRVLTPSQAARRTRRGTRTTRLRARERQAERLLAATTAAGMPLWSGHERARCVERLAGTRAPDLMARRLVLRRMARLGSHALGVSYTGYRWRLALAGRRALRAAATLAAGGARGIGHD